MIKENETAWGVFTEDEGVFIFHSAYWNKECAVTMQEDVEGKAIVRKIAVVLEADKKKWRKK